MLIKDPALQRRTDWILESGPDINPVPADNFVGVHVGEEKQLRIANFSSQQWGGALLACKRKVPMLTGSAMDRLIYCALEVDFHISDDDWPFLWAHETDLKCCVHGAPNGQTHIPNIFDLSAQVDMSKGGMFQIDKEGGGWVDTGILIPPVPNRWNHLMVRSKMDIAGGTFSVLSVNEIPIPSELQNVPLLKSNWQPVAAVQLQNEVSKPGVLIITYDAVSLYWSDQPF
jgi:hypothetical protein